ncbi:MAG: DDE-type integrase/transposase/recombinase [Candidatus Nanopelagicales bacterium]|nr:DDE-type integrase/transposase/recombinase [Candidatus Nanopelagicales bacterium]
MSLEQAEQLADFYQQEAALVAAIRAAGWSQTKALKLIGLAASSWHYRQRPRPKSGCVVAHTARRCDSWLTEAETAAIIAELTGAFAAKKSVHQAYYEALDAGQPVASLKSWYRIANTYLNADRPVRRTRTHRCAAMPQWEAFAPMQVWSWDITMLPGPYRGVNYCLYAVIDVFSRKIVAWRVEDAEVDELAAQMFRDALQDGPRPGLLHSDRGASMTSHALAATLRDLGIQPSRNRPRVSNDNPFSEAWFKTAKYQPDYPGYFHDLEHARTWAEKTIESYNNHHRHSSLAGHTPASVHDGTWVHIHQQRQATLDQLHQANPSRYRRRPRAKTPMASVALNPQTPTDRLQPG